MARKSNLTTSTNVVETKAIVPKTKPVLVVETIDVELLTKAEKTDMIKLMLDMVLSTGVKDINNLSIGEKLAYETLRKLNYIH